jgi:ABC-2 type transport system ATP-binding protein
MKLVSLKLASHRLRETASMQSGNPSLAPQAPALLEVAEMTKRYGDELALADVGFSVQAGEIVGLIGPNGAGKTTLLEAIAGVLPADSGRILWRGAPLSLAVRSRWMFYLPDGVRPWHDQYVSRALAFFGAVYRRPSVNIQTAVTASGLAPVLHKRISTLSKGYARRMMWAFTMLAPHPLLLMDEPFDGFDLRQTREMISLLRQIAAGGRTFLLSIHQLTDAERACDHFVLLESGCVRGCGSLQQLREKTGGEGLEDVFLALT